MALVSVVVPTFNRLRRLKQVIAALEGQEYPLDQVEVIIVSDGSHDGTHEYLRSVQTPLRLTAIEQANQGPAAARNRGFRAAAGEHVLFIDDDVVPTPGLIREHMRLHAERPSRVVLGPMLSPEDFRLSPWVAWEQSMLMKQYEAMERGMWHASPRQFYTGNTSLARRFLIDSGGFDERFRRAEDVELAFRLEQHGVEFIYSPRAVGHHYAERSFNSWMATPYAYGRNDVIFSREREPWLLRTVREDFSTRNALTRSLVHACLDRPALSGGAEALLKLAADGCYGLGAARLTRVAYSAIFNLRYYQGVADELGGRGQFFAPAERAAPDLAEL